MYECCQFFAKICKIIQISQSRLLTKITILSLIIIITILSLIIIIITYVREKSSNCPTQTPAGTDGHTTKHSAQNCMLTILERIWPVRDLLHGV